jgi:hypothetical protein
MTIVLIWKLRGQERISSFAVASLQPLPGKKDQFGQAFARLQVPPIAFGSGSRDMGRVSMLLMAAIVAFGLAAMTAAEEQRASVRPATYSNRPDPRYRAWLLRPKRRDEPFALPEHFGHRSA